MLKWVVAFSALICAMCSSSSDKVTGTATDTNSGTIAGLVLNDTQKYQDSVVVELYAGDSVLAKRMATGTTPEQSLLTANGEFSFDSLPAGTYSIRVSKDSLVIGEELGIELAKGEKKTVNITIVIIINQTFNITNSTNNQNVVINNFYMVTGTGALDTVAGQGIVVTFIEQDTVSMKVGVTTGGQSDTLTIVFVRQQDGTYASLPVVTALPIEIVDGSTIVNSGTASDSTAVRIEGEIREETR